MRIKLDENLPDGLVARLSTFGHDVQTVIQEGLKGKFDRAIWEAAQREGRFLLTQDLDFSDDRRYAPGTHHGILLVRLRVPGRIDLFRRVEGLFRMENVSTWEGCFVVATDHKVRVRRPPGK